MLRSIVWLLLIVGLVAACAREPDGVQSPTEPPGGAVADDRAGAPLIDSPRDLRSRAADPCRSLLSPLRLRQLGYDGRGEPRVTVLGSPSCTWRAGRAGRQVEVAVVVDRSEDLFVQSYRRRVLPEFRSIEVAGLPGVELTSPVDPSSCTTTIGVADRQTLDINGQLGTRSSGEREANPCDLNREIAEEIVATLPPL